VAQFWSPRGSKARPNCCDFNNDLLDRLVALEGRTWLEMMIHDKKSHHHVSVSDLIKEAQDRLGELHIYEDELFSLRLNGKGRLFGILSEGIFQIVWYDCNHEICPSHKKHT